PEDCNELAHAIAVPRCGGFAVGGVRPRCSSESTLAWSMNRAGVDMRVASTRQVGAYEISYPLARNSVVLRSIIRAPSIKSRAAPATRRSRGPPPLSRTCCLVHLDRTHARELRPRRGDRLRLLPRRRQDTTREYARLRHSRRASRERGAHVDRATPAHRRRL